MKVLLTGINSKYIHSALGVRSVAVRARQQGYDVDLLEETVNTPLLNVLDTLMFSDWDLYAFDVHIWSRTFVQELVTLLRKVRPECVIVLGGPEVSYIAQGDVNQELIRQADYIIQGEGEQAFSDLLAALQGICDDRSLPKFWHGTPADLDQLPFAYPDLPQVLEQHKIVYYETTRGCPFRCSYCLSSVEHKLRRRSLHRVLEDLDRFIALDVPLVKFVDRTYNLDEDFYLPIFRYLAAAHCSTTFHFEVKADLFSDTVLNFLTTVPRGRFQFEVGIQSVNSATLEAINRTNNWHRLEKVCKQLVSQGNIHLHTDLIVGLPYEGMGELRRSFNEVFALGAPMLQLGFLKVLPGTEMAQRAKEYGMLYMNRPPYEIMQTKWLSYDELAFLRRFDKIFDVVYNGGHFPNFLQRLLQRYGEPFVFFADLTRRWPLGDAKTYNARSVARALYLLYGSEGTDVLQQDIFEHIHNWKPDWLDWSKYSRRSLRNEKRG